MTTRTESKRARAALDARLTPLGPSEKYTPPRAGWVRAIRDALGMSAADLGRRLGVSHASVFELERSERARTARIDTLQRAAEALDCTLVYAFLPRRGLETTARAQAERVAQRELHGVQHTMALEDQGEPVEPAVHEEIVQQLLASKGLWSREP